MLPHLVVFRATRHEFWFEEFGKQCAFCLLPFLLSLPAASLTYLYYIDVLLQLQGVEPSTVYSVKEVDHNSPFLQCSFPSQEVAQRVAQRSVLIKLVIELMGCGQDYERLVSSVLEDCPELLRKKYLKLPGEEESPGAPWKMNVMAYGQKFNMKEQAWRREQVLARVNIRGPVKMKAQDLNVFCLLEDVSPPEDNPERKPEQIYFGRLLAEGMVDVVEKFTLKKRKFLGPTSTESELAFLMANQAKVQRGSFVLDPFVGTGSILVPAAYFGAVCFGCDIDARILEGKQHNCFSNFKQYDLPLPELWRMDVSPRGNSCFRCPPGGVFDAIICDPPYGIRAGARKCGSRKARIKPVPEKYKDTHIASTQVYPSHDLMPDLIDTAARYLRLNGRLVYLLPVAIDKYKQDILPRHPCLKLVANSEDFLTLKVSRRLITMEKVAHYDEAQSEEYERIKRDCAQILKDADELPGKSGGTAHHEDAEGNKNVRYHLLPRAQRKKLKRKSKEEIRLRRGHPSGSST